MAGNRGYRNYRGRRPKGKIILAVILVLVILAAIAVMYLAEHVVYDETGTLHLDLPWQEDTAPEEDISDVSLELTIQEPKILQKVWAFSLTDMPLTQEKLAAAQDRRTAAADEVYNSVAVTMKDSSGTVYFDAAPALSGAVVTEPDTAAALAELTASQDHTIARLSCFHDPKAANDSVGDVALKNTDGFMFYDGSNSQWLDPSKEGTQEYLGQLMVECAALGFDEILLTDFGFPTTGKLEKIQYPVVGMQACLRSFLTAMRSALDTAGYSQVLLSVELPEAVIRTGCDETAGLVLVDILSRVDRVYAVTAPESVIALTQAMASFTGGESTDFVPELTAYVPGGNSCLVLGTE